ncbi:hypothetical protein FCOIX_11548 [Fusarium coicis]|nr:hypothetical protein FCOIX_11548 [Fusarium coicis]
MHDYKGTIFKLVGRFNIQGGVMKQAFATNVLCENGLQVYNDKKHEGKDIGILVISEAEYNKPSDFVELVRESGGRLVKKKWIEDLHFKDKWFDPCGDYLWEKLVLLDEKDARDDDNKYLDNEWQDDDYGDDDESDDDYEPDDDDDESDDDYESDDDESDDDESDDDESDDDEYEDDEESGDEAYWTNAYKPKSEDESYETCDAKPDKDSRQLRSQALVHLAAPLT